MDELTVFLFEMAGLAPCRILDMRSGSGETISCLKNSGFDAVRLDQLPCEAEPFDAVISEDALAAAGTAQLMKQGGMLLLAGVCRSDVTEHIKVLEQAGFQVLHVEDATPLWQASHTNEEGRYFLTVCEKL